MIFKEKASQSGKRPGLAGSQGGDVQAGPPLREKVSAIHDLPAVESLRGRFASGFLLKEGFAAFAQ